MSEIRDMSLDDFEMYLRAAYWYDGREQAARLNDSTLASAAGFSGDKGVLESVDERTRALRNLHKQIGSPDA